jgi:hypothetical protein
MLHKNMFVASLLAVLLMAVSCAVRAGSDASKSDIDSLRKEVEDLRKQLNSKTPARSTTVDKALESKGYGPDAGVKTREGRLTITGLLQAWYYAPETDHRALFSDHTLNGIDDTNEASQYNSFRIRRSELSFKMDIHENVTAYVRIDPSKEASSFPLVTDNQANVGYIYKSLANVGPQYQTVNATPGSNYAVSNVQNGTGLANTMLEDAWINYHGVIPHHDFYVGQMRPFVGEEGIRDNGQLDFAERSFCGLLDDRYDLGAAFHGRWWDDRFQYWGGVYDGAGNFFGSATSPSALTGGVQTQTSANRSDDNSSKDLGFRLLVRPVYCNETWGNLEVGGAAMFGWHGSDNSLTPLSAPDNGLTAVKTNAYDYSAWLCYKPGAIATGLWLRGEWKLVRDRMAPGSVEDVTGSGALADPNLQEIGRPISTSGFYAAIGYRLSESCWRDTCPCFLKSFEFAGRYQEFQNVLVANPANTIDTLEYRTKVVTAGVNYYIKGHYAKIQANYNFVYNPRPDNVAINFHNTRDDSFVVNFQVAF